MRLKMMGGGDSIDYDSLTVTARDVPEGLIFIGAGSEDEQIGTLPNMEKMQDSPGYSESKANVPVHYAVMVAETVDTNGNDQIVMVPPLGKYPGNERAWIGCYPSDIGITPEIIAAGHAIGNTRGTYGSDSNMTDEDLRAGKIGYGASGRIVGGAYDYGAILKTLAAGESYIINEGYYGAGKVTAKSLASQTAANAIAAYILKDYTAWVNGVMITGIMANLSSDATITHTASNKTKVILGDAVFLSENSDGTKRVQIRYNGAAGYILTNTLFAVTQAAMASAIGLTADKLATGASVLSIAGNYKGLGDAAAENVLKGKKFSTKNLSNATGTMVDNEAKTTSLDPGGSYTIPKGFHNGSGKVTAKTKYIKQLEAQAYRGFNMNASDYEPGYEQSFTMPAAGIVYYNGISACYSSSRNVVCEIYKNGTLMDSRNMTKSDTWRVRGTMVAKSFSAAKGDVIKVVAKATSGTHALAMIDAACVYFA